MKARIKKTGELVNIASYAKITLESCDSWGNPIEVSPEEIELIDDNQINPEEEKLRHWETIRQQTAIAAIQGFCTAPVIKDTESMTIDDAAKYAVEIADALVERLKGE